MLRSTTVMRKTIFAKKWYTSNIKKAQYITARNMTFSKTFVRAKTRTMSIYMHAKIVIWLRVSNPGVIEVEK